MTSGKHQAPISTKWAHFRFGIVGRLLAAPPPKGQLHVELEKLAAQEWLHPITGEMRQFEVSTIERWYYRAKASRDPVTALKRKTRRDLGEFRAIGDALARKLLEQFRAHSSWSYQLHRDNLAALVRDRPELGPMPSYPTVRRFMMANGFLRRPKPKNAHRPGVQKAQERLEKREVRSFEVEQPNGLWHLDFHVGSRKILTPQGEWEPPHLLGILDDHSRLNCHAQWYLGETTGHLVHGFGQAVQKRGRPGALMSDRGAAMMAAEFTEGLLRLSIAHQPTLGYSPYQNGKQETFWAQVEGRLLSMLEGCRELTLARLNEATQAWLELEYNRKPHRETGQPPIERFLDGTAAGLPSPESDVIRFAFTQATRRQQRRSDGTVSIEGVRYEIPSRFRHIRTVTVRYARWDLSRVFLVDGRTEAVLARLYPLDRNRNADRRRRSLEPVTALAATTTPPPDGEIAPLLRELMREAAATGLPPAYLPHPSDSKKED